MPKYELHISTTIDHEYAEQAGQLMAGFVQALGAVTTETAVEARLTPLSSQESQLQSTETPFSYAHMSLEDRRLSCKRQLDLTRREQDILGLLPYGLTNQAIGEQLSLTMNTIRSALETLSFKMNESNRTAMASIYNGIIPIPEDAQFKNGPPTTQEQLWLEKGMDYFCLSSKQQSVARLLHAGCDALKIAATLSMTNDAVRFHIRNILYEKTQTSSTSEAIKRLLSFE